MSKSKRARSKTDIKAMFMFELIMAEHEIMDLYHKQMGIEACNYSQGLFTLDEQIERYAQNVAFWKRLSNDYKNNQNKTAKWIYITKKECEFRMQLNEKLKTNQMK
jgi:hypothetical protein